MSGDPQSTKSEVARLIAQIDAEHQAALQGFEGPALGTAQHEFITAKMDRIGEIQEQLEELIGINKSMMVVCRIMEGDDVKEIQG